MANGQDSLDLYAQVVLGEVPRILGLGDRQRGSLTYGCFDRIYWHYKLLDLPNARYQEAALLLALLYKNDFSGNLCFGREKVREWAEGAVAFWVQARNRDGSLNEVYPHERSFCATAFSTHGITEALLILGLDPPVGLGKTADWLAWNDNSDVANQMAAAALALHGCFQLTGDERYRLAARDKVDRLLVRQDASGFFPEYGGYDMGYLSLTLGCLARYQCRVGDERLSEALHRALVFLEDRIEEDGSFEIEGTSRRTQFLYPSGFVLMGSDVVQRLLAGLRANAIVNPAWLDDRYVIQLTTDYLQAYLEGRDADD